MRPGEYRAKGQTPPIHIQLAEKLEKRLGAGAEGTYRPGDRIQFVVTEETVPGQKTSECGEDPDYAWKMRLPMSQQHYLENAVYGTFMRVLEPVISPDGIRLTDENARKRVLHRRFDDFVKSGASRAKRIKIEAPPSRGLMAFAAFASKRCELCGKPSGQTQFCSSHDAAEIAAFTGTQQDAAQTLQQEREVLWKTCKACVAGIRLQDGGEAVARLPPLLPDIESLEAGTPCGNNTCETYWKRRRNDKLCRKT